MIEQPLFEGSHPATTPLPPQERKEVAMDAKHDWLIDNAAVRVTLNTLAFVLWAAAPSA